MELDNLTLRELRDLQSQVAKAIASYEDRKKKDALAELEEKARSLGFSLAELTGMAPARKQRAATSAKYANPMDPSETWSGRGRKPRWFIDAIAAGKTAEDLAI